MRSNVCQASDTVSLSPLALCLFSLSGASDVILCLVSHTHPHKRFTALLYFVQDYPGKPAPET